MTKNHIKKQNIFLKVGAVFLFSTIFFSCSSISLKNPKKENTTNPISSEYVDFKEVDASFDAPEKNQYMSSSDALEDLDMICYLLKAAYAGYDEGCTRGFDESNFKKAVLARLPLDFLTNSFVLETRNVLLNFFSDSHLSFMGYNDWYVPVVKPMQLYYSSIYVKKVENGLEVLYSEEKDILPGQKVDISEENLFYYPILNGTFNENCYRIGQFFETIYYMDEMPERLLEVLFNVDGKTVSVPVKYDYPLDQMKTVRTGIVETESTGYVSLSSFMQEKKSSRYKVGSDKNFEKWFSVPQKFFNKKNLIIDLRGNGGGIVENGIHFLDLLYVNKPDSFNWEKKWPESHKILLDDIYSNFTSIVSFPVVEATLIWEKELFSITKEIKEHELILEELKNCKEKHIYNFVDMNEDFSNLKKSSMVKANPYRGKILILVDKNSASASEFFIAYAKKLFNNQVKVLGQNTCGCISYWGIFPFHLPQSKVTLSLANIDGKTFFDSLPNYHGEGKGFYPDIWCSFEDLLPAIVQETNDSELLQKLKYIGMALQ